MAIFNPEDSFNLKLIKALGIEQKYVTDIRILSHANDIVRVEVEYLLVDDNGIDLLNLLQEYYLVKKPDGTH